LGFPWFFPQKWDFRGFSHKNGTKWLAWFVHFREAEKICF
jgi:Ras-related protein Rab-8A